MRISTGKVARTVLGALMVGLLSGGVLAQEPQVVGKIIDIDGPQLKTNRLSEGDKWYQAYPSMRTLFKERLEANPETTATIQFDIGGRGVVSPGTRVEVLDKDVVKIESGTMWAKFDSDKLKGQGRKFSIQTAGGVMGIEGTEFIVKTDPVTKKTELVVVEGSVNVDGTSVTPGKEASFGDKTLNVAEYIAYNSPESAIRDAAFSKLDPETSRVLRPIVNRALWYVPGRYRLGRYFYGRNFWVARNAIRAIRDPQGAAISMVTSQAPVGGGMLGGALRKATAPAKPPSNLKFDGRRFQWKKSKGSDKYAVVISNDSDMQDVVWYGATNGSDTKLDYPDYGPELQANKSYYMMVSSLDGEGKTRGNKNGVLSAKTSFVSKGHTPKYGTVAGVTVPAADGTAPKASWNSYKNANTYLVYFKSGENIVWSGETQDASYAYPVEGRALEAGDYQVVVEAYDAGGLKMAESQPTTFATTGWEATALNGEPRTDAREPNTRFSTVADK